MSRIAYVNGQYVLNHYASVHINDRGYQFADGIYEVIAITNRKLVDRDDHITRLYRSLAELRIPEPMSERAMNVVMDQVIRRNIVRNGIIYIQITRGVTKVRDHAYSKNLKPSVVMTARTLKPVNLGQIRNGVSIISIPDLRWKRCDIKSISLLPNVLGKQIAKESGAYEAWMIDNQGYVTEGTSSNAWIVTANGELVTRPTNHSILKGVTRVSVMTLAKQEGFAIVERAFTLEEAKMAKEAFLTSTTSLVKPVTEIDEAVIANGKPGDLTEKLFELYKIYTDDIGNGA
jgi:D-alanine transaminase